MVNIATTEPQLKTPFPSMPDIWRCPKTGIEIPKLLEPNIKWRGDLLRKAEHDIIMQRDLLAASRESQIFWVNAFAWTTHQWDVDPKTGKRIAAVRPHMPFITWEIQDEMCNAFDYHLKVCEDMLVDKSREMGASWMCTNFMHWLWLFRQDHPQLLEMSRNENYVDLSGNMKALFQKHDYINGWLPKWMLPPGCLVGQKYRTKMHMLNVVNGACIDGESTTEHAASGDRRLVILLDEFAKVKEGRLMRSATRDAGLMRIINSTPAGAGTEYARWKNSGQVKVFVLPFYEHPEKGAGRYFIKKEDGSYQIRSPWYDEESKVRSPREMAREIDRLDTESGETFFTLPNIDVHKKLFGREPRARYHVHFNKKVPNDDIRDIIKGRRQDKIVVTKGSKGPLRVWTALELDRPDQTQEYIMGIDIGKGQGASESVISVKCKRTGEKIMEWRDANTPPYEMARIAVALAVWIGGRRRRRLPFMKWENNGPGWDFGKLVVQDFGYPYYFRMKEQGKITEKMSKKYGFQTNTNSKFELLSLYDRVMAHGGYINHSKYGLEQMKQYVHYDGGGIGPACLIEESASARKTHGDVVIADALTLDDSDIPKIRHKGSKYPERSFGHRMEAVIKKKKKKKRKSWRKSFDLTRG